jgi:hypothetical protein
MLIISEGIQAGFKIQWTQAVCSQSRLDARAVLKHSINVRTLDIS